MAGDSVIGALRVVLGADTAALDKGLKDAQSSLSAFGVAAAAGLAAIAAGVAAAAVQITGSVKSTIDSADQLNKMSQSTGLTTEELSKLKVAAELSDISMESLGKSMGKLSKAMVAAGADASSQAGRAFATMGIEVKNAADGSLRPSSEVLKDLADKFADYRDGAEKTSLAIALFGKAGAAMIPLLNEGRDGLDESAKMAERYGLVLSKQTTVAAEAFNDNLKKMDLLKQGLITTMTARLLPAFEALSGVMLKSREESGLWSAVADGLASMMNKIVSVGIALITTWQQIFATASNLKEALGQFSKGDFTGGFETMKKSAADTAVAFSDMSSRIGKVLAPTEVDKAMTDMSAHVSSFVGMMDQVSNSMKPPAPSIPDAINATKDALQKFLDSQAKSTAAQNANADSVGKTIGQQAYLKTTYEAAAIALANNIPLTAALNMQIALAGQSAADAALKVGAANAVLTLQSPYEKLQSALANYDLMLQQNMITVEQHRALSVKAADDMGVGWQAMGSSLAGFSGSMSQLAGSFAKDNKAMGIASKAFGITQAIINAQVAATKALALYGPTPMGFIGVAAAVAQGAASVATIASQSFAAGGLVTGPGTGMSDSIPAMLSNGEFVMNAEATSRFRPQLEEMNGNGAEPRRGAGGAGNVVNLSMPIATTRDALRDIIDGLNGMFADGYRLNVVSA